MTSYDSPADIEDSFDDSSESQSLRRDSKPASLEAGVLAEVRGVCATDLTQVLMVATLILLALVVIGQSAVRDIKHQWAPCDSLTILSKHKFCVNVTSARGLVSG